MLESIDFKNNTVVGDTRFDRVAKILQQNNTLDFISAFKNNQYTIVAGSTWRDDEELLINYINKNDSSKEKFIIAPHNINKEAIATLQKSINKKTVLFSEKEEKMLEGIFNNIEQEYQTSIDQFSQDVMVSHLELLLNYCNRFYNRQFLTRKKAGNDLLSKMEELLDDYFKKDKHIELGLPTVQYFAEKMNVSSNYLSDMLRTLTGQSTQQHIHEKLIEKAKEKLSTTALSVGEIAYELGFEHSQSFSKLFKTKTNLSPSEFRQSFN